MNETSNINDLIQKVVDVELKKQCNKCSEDYASLSKDFVMVCEENEKLKELIQSSQTDVTDIDVGKIKTRGDVIREMDNDNLAIYIENQIKSKCNSDECEGCEYCYYHEEDGIGCNGAILKSLNETVEGE